MDINHILFAHGLFSTESKNSTLVKPITNFKASIIGKSISLTWINPNDVSFAGVRIQRKTGSHPSSISDGVTVFNGMSSEFTDIGLIDNMYYYRAFTYDSQYNFNNDESQKTSIDFVSSKIYTVVIDLSNSNPSTSVTYADDAVGMNAASRDWDSFFPFNQIKPVMFKNGMVNYYLNPNNYSQKQAGGVAPIGTGEDGDVMIQFPKVWTYTRKIAKKLYISLSESKVNDDYKCYAHTTNGIEKDYFYIGAYEGYISEDDKLNSYSGVNITHTTSLEDFMQCASNKGAGYRVYSFYQYSLIQILFLIRYKNLNSQTALGAGLNSIEYITGRLNTLSMHQSSTLGVKVFGIEHLWGSMYEWIIGVITDANKKVYTSTEHSLVSSNYSFVGDFVEMEGYLSDVIGTNEAVFLAAGTNGSSSTYFSDYADLYGEFNTLCNMGGLEVDHNLSGIFSLFSDYTTPQSFKSTRLCYL